MNYMQKQNFHRAARLNRDNIRAAFDAGQGVAYLRGLYRSCMRGQQFGLCSGYQG